MAMGKRIKMGTIPGLVGNFTKKDGIKSFWNKNYGFFDSRWYQMAKSRSKISS